MLKAVASQTREYEEAGATHREAACLAAVTGRLHAPKGAGLVLGNEADSRAIDRCRIRQSSLDKITKWVDAQLRASHAGPYAPRATSSGPTTTRR